MEIFASGVYCERIPTSALVQFSKIYPWLDVDDAVNVDFATNGPEQL